MPQIYTSPSWPLVLMLSFQDSHWVFLEGKTSLRHVFYLWSLCHFLTCYPRQIYTRSFESTVYERISRLVLPYPPPKRVIVFLRQWWGTIAGHCGLCWVWICRLVPCCSGQDLLELLILFSAAVDVCVHGGVPCKDHEEGPSWRS